MQYLHPENAIKMIWKKIPDTIKTAFFTAFTGGFIIHMFIITNKLPNHDDVSLLFSNMSKAQLGRWFSAYPAAISSSFSMPWFIGLLTIIYLSFSSVFIVAALNIKQKIYCALIAGLLVSLPAIGANFLYMQCADVFAFALMLACFSLFLAQRFKYGYIAAVVPLTVSMGTYQPYFPVAAGLMILILIKDVLSNQDKWSRILIKGVKFAGTLGVSVAVYYAIVMLTTRESSLSSYRGIDQMGQISLPELPGLISAAYKNIYLYYMRNLWPVHYSFMPALLTLALLLCVYIIALRCIKEKIYKDPGKLILLAVLCVLFPLGSNIIYVMTPANANVHMLMAAGVVNILFFLPVIADMASYKMPDTADTASYKMPDTAGGSQTARQEKLKNITVGISCWILIAVSAAYIYNYSLTMNKAYLAQHFAYEKGYAQSAVLISRIQSTEGYRPDTEIIFIERPRAGNGTPDFDMVMFTGVDQNLFTDSHLPTFIKQQLNFTNPVTEMLLTDAAGNPEIQDLLKDMRRYPAEDSVMFYGGKIYVCFNK